MQMSAVAVAIEPQSHLRAELAEGIKAAWHKAKEHCLKIGRLLNEAKGKLPHGEFRAMILRDLPFKPRQAQNFMEMASDPRLTNTQHAALFEGLSGRALLAASKLNDNVFESAMAHGVFHEGTTEREIKSFDEQITDRGYFAPAPFAIESRPHRPNASKYGHPSAPAAAGAVIVAELIYLMVERRHALALSQADVDHKVGWAEGLCSKYEIPYDDDGRVPSLDAMFDWCQALGCGIQLVAL